MTVSEMLGLGGSLLLIASFGLHLAQTRMLLRKYEAETSLSESQAIRSAFFVHALPAFMRAAHYAFHLLLVSLMPEGLFRRTRGFSDLRDRSEVLGHFSRGERRRVVATTSLTCAGLLILMLAACMDLWRS